MIKSIDTRYNGYNFRSRTEARWAVFFDFLGWKWDYEIRDFMLPSGRYLPDFYFPDINVWAEVKPEELTPIELLKCKELSLFINKTDNQSFDVILLEGVPSLMNYRTISNGLFFYDVVCMPLGDKFYPFYLNRFDIHYCSHTLESIINARSKRFEFEDRDLIPLKNKSI